MTVTTQLTIAPERWVNAPPNDGSRSPHRDAGQLVGAGVGIRDIVRSQSRDGSVRNTQDLYPERTGASLKGTGNRSDR
jgi:hypothetical protein